AVGKLMLGAAGYDACKGYAQRTNLPSYTRNTITDLGRLIETCDGAVRAGFALDNEEAELHVGCIGVLLFDGTGNVAAGLSVSSPIERRRHEWIPVVQDAGKRISSALGFQAA
ncbi:MAG: IclR family transcriptional regulator domain-containing protein, partial [Gammaproteobacteria bacterium]